MNHDELSDSCFQELRALIHEMTGITIASNRKSLVQGRLRKRVLALALPSYEDYVLHLKTNHSEKQAFIDLVTTNETSFFRTPRVWDYIEKVFIPEWFGRHRDQRPLNIWSAAASSGEEAHSLGFLCQAFRELHPSFSYSILGTDISQEMVTACQAGFFEVKRVEDLKKNRPEYFLKYTRAERGGVVVRPEIKTRLKFVRHNLFMALPTTEKFDLILLRNVLIYFTPEDQKKAIEKLEPRLTSEGVLIIGESESLASIETDFKSIATLIYAKSAA